MVAIPSDVRAAKRLRTEEDHVQASAESVRRMAASSHPVRASVGVDTVHDVQLVPKDVEFDFMFNPVMPPARQIGQRVLDHVVYGNEWKNDRFFFQGGLEEQWESMHNVREHDKVGVIRALPPTKQSLLTMAVCRRVGHCMCGPSMAIRRSFRQSLSGVLSKWLVKGKVGRTAYDKGEIVLRVCDFVGDEVSFGFLGFGNLNDSCFIAMRLERVLMPSPAGILPLVNVDGAPARDIEIIGESLDFSSAAGAYYSVGPSYKCIWFFYTNKAICF